MTLILTEGAGFVRLLWALMDVAELDAAREALRKRERIAVKDCAAKIGSWQRGDQEPTLISELPAWASAHGIEAVVWTSLGPHFNDHDRVPTEDEVVEYLRGLRGSRRDNAERYIRRTPLQVDTRYRRRIEAELGWTYEP
jgi:hypothetical protein